VGWLAISEKGVRVLKLDIDSFSKRIKLNILKRLLLFKRYTGSKIVDIKEVKSNHGLHIYIEFIPKVELDNRDIVFFQLFLLSDWRRELFNWLRVKHNMPHWNVLFKKKI
jgi:hypothetical protein